MGLQRLDDTFTPVIQEAIAQLESVGARFEAESLTENEIGLGEMTFVITPGTRASWVVTDYVAISAIDDPDHGLIAGVVSYDRTTGILVVDVTGAIGDGLFDAWKIRVSAPPDLEHATRTDNPHLTTAAQVGAYTTGQTDAAIAAALAGYSPPAHGHVIADVTGLQTALDGKAATGHGHAIAEVTGLQAALDSKEAADADILKKDVSATLTVGYKSTSYNAGTITSGTLTPAVANGNLQHYTNNGAHTLAPYADATTMIIDVTNGASAGVITTSGFNKTTGDTRTSTNGHKFRLFISVANGGSHIHTQALQ